MSVSKLILQFNKIENEYKTEYKRTIPHTKVPELTTLCFSKERTEKEEEVFVKMKSKYPEIAKKNFHKKRKNMLIIRMD